MESPANKLAPYWIWLSQVLGPGSKKLSLVLDEYGSPDRLYDERNNAAKNREVFSPGEINKLITISLDDCKEIEYNTRQNGFHLVCYDDENYPTKLRQLDDCPCVLYVDGKLPKLSDTLNIGVVGTRRASVYGCNAALKICGDLAKAGVVIVSGFAIGIDEYAHRAVVQSDGVSVAVLGCGLDVNYPSQNYSLRQIVRQNGALITEFPLGTQPIGRNFPVRNRLIAGLGEGVLVVQAPQRSGALITARWALEQGKDVFAVPDSIFDSSGMGNNNLIKDGAILVSGAGDILNNYRYRFGEMIRSAQILSPVRNDVLMVASPPSGNTYAPQPVRTGDLTDVERKIYDALSAQPLHVEELCQKAEVSIAEMLSILTQFEIDGVAKSYPGRKYGLISMK